MTGVQTCALPISPAPGSSIVKSDISCNGNNDGSVVLTASGGTLPYTYLWDDPGSSNTKDLSNLGAGTYVVNITDEIGRASCRERV